MTTVSYTGAPQLVGKSRKAMWVHNQYFESALLFIQSKHTVVVIVVIVYCLEDTASRAKAPGLHIAGCQYAAKHKSNGSASHLNPRCPKTCQKSQTDVSLYENSNPQMTAGSTHNRRHVNPASQVWQHVFRSTATCCRNETRKVPNRYYQYRSINISDRDRQT